MTCIISTFGLLDWSALAAYMLIVVAIGLIAGRKQHDMSSFFLSSRSMPTWAVALSILATTLSAATFIGVPEITFAGDLSYLILNIGGVLAAIFVAAIFIPVLYHAGTITIYGYLDKRFGPPSAIAASLFFLFGRLLASGARLFIAGIAFSFMLFNDINIQYLVSAIVILGIIGTLYTACGGIRAVIWTDVAQIIIVVGAAIFSIFLLIDLIPLSIPQIIDTLSNTGGQNKLRVLNTSFNPFDSNNTYTLWAGFAVIFINTAALGADHDITQRMLTTRSAWKGSLSLIISNLLSIPVVLLFMIIGLLLYIYYGMPEVMGAAAPVEDADDARKIFPMFLLHHMPPGLAGLAMAGLFAAAMSSFDSAVNAMSASFVADLYLPMKKLRDCVEDEPHTDRSLQYSRIAVVVIGLLLTLFAVVAAYFQQSGGQKLIDFSLGIMAFAYAGLLGVFLTAILTNRGNNTSAIIALIAGAMIVLIMQPYIMKPLTTWLCNQPYQLTWPWWMVIATPTCFIICALPPNIHSKMNSG